MTKLPLLSLSVLTTLAMTGVPAMTSQAAVVRAYQIPVNVSGNFSNGTFQMNDTTNNLIGSMLNGNGNCNQIPSYNVPCDNWNTSNCPIIPGTPMVPSTPVLRPNVPEIPGGGTETPDLPDNGGPVTPDLPDGGGAVTPDLPGGGAVTPDLPGGGGAVTPDLPGGGQELPDASGSEFAERVLELVNEERAKAGVSPLTLDSSAQAAADKRAEEIQTNFSHTRPGGSSYSTALTEAGVKYRTSGENIAYGQNSPEAVMQTWMNSEGHRANILNRNYTSIGIGHARSGNTDYWTQLFFN